MTVAYSIRDTSDWQLIWLVNACKAPSKEERSVVKITVILF